MNKVMLSIGHGYSAGALGRQLLADGWTIYGTTRSADKAASMQAQGITPIIWPDTDLGPFINRASHVLTSVAPTAVGDAVLAAHGDDLRKGSFEWVGYLSTTGVYGDHNGDWVDETTPLTPTTKRGEMRRDAEAAWAKLGLPLHIFRLAGIYGPGRGPFAKVRAGTARRIIKQGQVFSRIHVDDIAQVLAASIAAPRAGAIYNLCDNDPAPPEDVIGYAAQLLGMPMPEAVDFETADMTPMARSFYAENKKVSNDLIKSELGVSLKFPDYRIGLETLLAQS
jgi:nucleoside-diphosphate-sugar epimerase